MLSLNSPIDIKGHCIGVAVKNGYLQRGLVRTESAMVEDDSASGFLAHAVRLQPVLFRNLVLHVTHIRTLRTQMYLVLTVAYSACGILSLAHGYVELLVVPSVPLVPRYRLYELLDLRRGVAPENIDRLALLLSCLERICLAPIVVLRGNQQIRAGYVIYYLNGGIGMPDGLLQLTLVHTVGHYVRDLDGFAFRMGFGLRISPVPISIEWHTCHRRRPTVRRARHLRPGLGNRPVCIHGAMLGRYGVAAQYTINRVRHVRVYDHLAPVLYLDQNVESGGSAAFQDRLPVSGAGVPRYLPV